MMRLLSMLLTFAVASHALAAADDNIRDLDGLLQHVRAVQAQERTLQQQREAAFLADRNAQQTKLEQARRANQQRVEATKPLQEAINQNRATISELRKQLKDQLAATGDIYGVYREFATGFANQLDNSLTATQLPGRKQALAALNPADGEASVEQMQQLWLLLQEELTESGKLSHYKAEVVDIDGHSSTRDVLRIGTFTTTSQGNFLRHIPETGELLLLSRQPDRGLRNDMAAFEAASGDSLLPVHVDPTHGNLLALLVQAPDFWERTAQGKEIGYITLVLGAIGALLFLVRIAWLLKTSRAVKRQMSDLKRPDAGNPLGRLLIAADASGQDSDALQLILDDAVLKELPALESGQSLLKLLAAVAPLLGLLGTVTGMIETFQAISLFGSGDPQLMAGGISQALVTTVIGLVVAIPLLFGHSLLVARSRTLVQLLDEQSAGIIARRLESGQT